MAFKIIVVIALSIIGNTLAQDSRYTSGQAGTYSTGGLLSNNFAQNGPNNYQQTYQQAAPVAPNNYRQATPAVQAFIPRVQPDQQYFNENPEPFQYEYNFQDEYGNQQYKEETADANGNVNGRYGYTDASGIYRQVEYSAGEYGVQFQIQTNEPGTKTSQPADVVINSDAVETGYQQPAQREVYQAPVGQSYQTPQQQGIYTTNPLQQIARGPARQQYIQPVQNTYSTGNQDYGSNKQY